MTFVPWQISVPGRFLVFLAFGTKRFKHISECGQALQSARQTAGKKNGGQAAEI